MPLTKKDLQAITKILDKRFEQVDKRFEQVDKRFEQVEKRFTSLEIKNQINIDNIVDELSQQMQDWRSDFYDKIDPILKEVQASFEERAINAHRISEHEDKLEDHEKRIANLES